jgi:lipopolysaccharide/colanic/teichoic acid biosynthesis glycosyltransferase
MALQINRKWCEAMSSNDTLGATMGMRLDGASAETQSVISSFGGNGASERSLQIAAKRVMDIVVSGMALLVLLPLFLVVAAAIRLESKGPVFFRQVRWGKDCQRINIYKFRSMRADLGDATGVQQTVKNDPRVTRLGAFLRSSNLDELPQLINVLKGDMSLIGPRCHAIGMKAAGVQYEELVPSYHQRHQMRPGITGLAQMRGLRGPTDTSAKSRARIACDLYYIENYSLMLDVKILYGTVRNEIFGGSGF